MRISSLIFGIMICFAAAYFAYQIIFIFPLVTSVVGIVFNILLIFCEMLAALFSIYLYHSIFCTIEWHSPKPPNLKNKPFVSFIMPTYDEDIKIVAGTLDACRGQDYPKSKYEIIVADDSADIAKANAIEEYCRKHKIKYIHRADRRGYKAGALNNAFRFSRGDVIALIDADDQPVRNFLTFTVNVLMEDKKTAFVQTRNAERNDDTNLVTGIGRMMRDLFFGSIMKSKDMRNLSIFCGSGGVIKRSAIEEIGGWPEETLTEDIDLSTTLFSRGYFSRYVNPIGCKGLLPSSFSGFVGQTYRWAHGTTRTLKLRWKLIIKIPGFWRKAEHMLSCSTYILGPAIVAIDLLMVVHLLTKVPIFHMYEPKFLWAFGVTLTLSSFLALLFVQFRDRRIIMTRVIAYIFAIYGLAVNFTRAFFTALIKRKNIEFFRTPRSKQKKNYFAIIRRFWPDTTIGLVSIYAGLINLSSPLYSVQATWVMLFGIGFMTAPVLALRYG
jgi:cellulose synthase/poly-beta-1,6-N-acetylglucosamine synthase-like glycosyltransferase